MKVTGWETLSCDAGWRNYHFLKIETDQGIVGWSEFNEAFGSTGLATVVSRFADSIVGEDVWSHERNVIELRRASLPSRYGMAAAAVAAIENALLDAKAKALGVPVYELLGGAVRDTVPVYWSHCASWRIEHPDLYSPRIDTLDGVREAGAEARRSGFQALKTNLYIHDESGVRRWRPRLDSEIGHDHGVDRTLIESARSHLEALRQGAGDDVELMVDLNFAAPPEGLIKLVDGLADIDLRWIEIDLHNPTALAEIRNRATSPISSGETLFGVRQFLPFLAERAVDVLIIDAIRNGVWQSVKIAAAAAAHDINVAPHNFYSHFATMMSLHFSAAVPNLSIMETDVDRIPWESELFDIEPVVVDGRIALPQRPGWGIEPIEDAIRQHPPRTHVI